MEFLKKNGWLLIGVASLALAIYIDLSFLSDVSHVFLWPIAILIMLRPPDKARAGKKLIELAVLLLLLDVMALKAVGKFLRAHVGISGNGALALLFAPFLVWLLWALAKEHMNELRGEGEPVMRERE